MESFEVIRQAAAALHAELVAAGADANQPMALVRAAVGKYELELAWLLKGDPALKGARAIFDHHAGVICALDEGDDSVRAPLIAHELGHVCIHAGSAQCTHDDIDPSRSTEAAPVGLQRVEDYGARERRELQANVFAREFLLPRHAARTRFLAGQYARTIAEKLQLPIDIVRQQLLDALLLPPVEAEELSPARPARPDPSQDRAAQHQGSAFQLQAGPGTGKTRTLVKRVLHLLGKGTDPASILVLTFSNRAAAELSERLTKAAPDAAPRIWIGTFHAFGLDLVRRYHDVLKLPADPILFDRSDAIEALKDILPTLTLVQYRNLWDPEMILRDMIGAISRAKDELADAACYCELAAAMLERAKKQRFLNASEREDAIKDADKALEVARVYRLYEDALRKHQAVDFGDLIMQPTKLIAQNEAIRTALRLRHRHILVDEYQDVNRASARLLKAIAGDGERLWVVGDARQSIYRFRGASSVNMVRFAEDYPGATIDQLEVNYRSSDEIIKTFQAVAARMAASTGMLPLRLTSNDGASGTVSEIRTFETLDDEEAGIAASVRELEASGVPLRDQAVLCRTNRRLNEIATALEVRGIPVLHLGSLFERDEIRDLLALLTLAVDPFGDALVRVGAMPRYEIPLQDVHTCLRQMRASTGSALRKLGELSEHESLSDAARKALSLLAKDLDGIPPASTAWQFLATYLLDRTDLLVQFATSDSVRERMRGVAIWQFLNFVRDRGPLGAGAPIQRILDRVRQLVLLAEERDLRQIPAGALHMDAVRLMTIHGSKGLEFEAAHIPGLTVLSIPSREQPLRCRIPEGMVESANDVTDHATEEECLFFVALSRAKQHLRLYKSRKTPDLKNRSPSPYLDWFSPSTLREIASPAMSPLPANAPRLQPITVRWPKDWAVTDSRLRSFEGCGRRFFYTHVLGLGNARKPTPFSQTHDCIYDLIDWLAETRTEGGGELVAAVKEFERLWKEKGPIDHAYAADYRRLADTLVEGLVQAGAGRRFRRAEPLAIDFANGRVIVEPDELAELPDGSVLLRKVRTGHKRSDEYDHLEYTLYLLAARQHFSGGGGVEALHLTDQVVERVGLSPAKLNTRRDRSNVMLGEIASGWFVPNPKPVTCPRCPHFFTCDAVSAGALNLQDS
jgi:superfamily I DNA/RNA helicase